MHELWVLLLVPHKLEVVAYNYNLGIQDKEIGKPGVEDQPQLYSKFKATLSYMVSLRVSWAI